VTKLLRLARPHFLLAGISLYLFGAYWAILSGSPFSLPQLILGYLIIFPGHLSISFSNDYFDVAVDSFGDPTLFSGGSGILVKYPHLREPARRIAIALILCSLALAVLYVLEYSAPFWFLAYVLAADLLGWFYAAPPLRLAYRKLGEVTNVLASGFLIPGMGYLVVHGSIDANGLLFTIPLMLYGLAFILSVEIPDLEMDLQGHKSTLVSRQGRRFGFIGAGLSVILATAYFIIFPSLTARTYPVDFRILGLLSLLPLAAGIVAIINHPLERQPATKIVNAIILSIATFFILADAYLILLSSH
jgi:1,4-dihydroxy-2-naphthoate octaprenyltransferase